jgi:hypothetical protein
MRNVYNTLVVSGLIRYPEKEWISAFAGMTEWLDYYYETVSKNYVFYMMIQNSF